MTVYVDDMYLPADVPNGGRVVRGVWCHMQADTREELDAMADRIGLRRSWIQYPDTPWRRHYDLTKTKRALAVQAGAVEVGMTELAGMRLAWRAAERERRTAADT